MPRRCLSLLAWHLRRWTTIVADGIIVFQREYLMMTGSGAQPDAGDPGEQGRPAAGPGAAGSRAAIAKMDKAIAHARAGREQCLVCGAGHDGAVTASLAARVQAYRAAHPGHEIVLGDVTGIAAVITRRPGGPEVLSWALDLPALLDMVGAPCAEELS
jgi:hypothetical protein